MLCFFWDTGDHPTPMVKVMVYLIGVLWKQVAEAADKRCSIHGKVDGPPHLTMWPRPFGLGVWGEFFGGPFLVQG